VWRKASQHWDYAGISLPAGLGPDKDPGKPATCGIFLPRKINSGFFSRPKIFAGPGDPDIFVKIRNYPKFHVREK
jgi:hypothetical protein